MGRRQEATSWSKKKESAALWNGTEAVEWAVALAKAKGSCKFSDIKELLSTEEDGSHGINSALSLLHFRVSSCRVIVKAHRVCFCWSPVYVNCLSHL